MGLRVHLAFPQEFYAFAVLGISLLSRGALSFSRFRFLSVYANRVRLVSVWVTPLGKRPRILLLLHGPPS